MTPYSYAIILILFIILVGGGIGLFLFIRHKQKNEHTQPLCNTQNWNSSCDFLQEKKLDSTIEIPPNVYLANFSTNSSFGGDPWSLNSYYAIRYIDEETGNFGPLSSWTSAVSTNVPINDLPCLQIPCCFPVSNGGCSTPTTLSGFNSIEIGTVGPINSSYFANVHRQTGMFDPSSEGSPIGVLLPSSGTFPFTFQDVNNPSD